MEVHKLLCLPRNLHLEVHKVLQPEPLTEHGGSQSAAPATNSARGGSQSAAPATNSARQETSEYSNHNGGTDRRPPQTTADSRRQPNSQSL